MESMDDYKEELEASLKKIRVGDVVTGTVIDVTDDAVIVDLKAYADGVIRKDDLSEDPDFNMAEMIHPGDEITATVMATNDGEGNMVLSKKEANQVLAWDKLKNMMEERTVVPVKIAEIVNAGAVAYLEGIRGFIPASRLSDEYVEDLKEFDGKTITEWIEWYSERYPNAVDNATEKIWDMYETMKGAFNAITKDMVENWVKDLVYGKTFCGLKFQTAIISAIANQLGKEWREANPEEEAKGIDGFIGEKPLQIKSTTYKLEARLSETINVPIVYYDKKKDGINIEYNPIDF